VSGSWAAMVGETRDSGKRPVSASHSWDSEGTVEEEGVRRTKEGVFEVDSDGVVVAGGSLAAGLLLLVTVVMLELLFLNGYKWQLSNKTMYQ